MKKKYFKLASLFLLSSLLIFSCNNPFNVFEESPKLLEDTSEKKYSPELENQKKGGITISFVEPESQRTVLPDIDITKLTSITLTGHKNGESTVQNLGSWSTSSQVLSEMIILEEGQWILELSANNDFLVFSDTKTVNVTIGQSQNVSFVLSADSTYGGLDYKLTFEGSAAKVDFTISKYNGSSFTEVVHNPDYTVTTEGSAHSINYSRLAGNSIEEGTYRMVVKFYGDTAGNVLLNTYSEIINIKAGFISKSTDKTINLNQMYSITYKTEYDVDLVPGDYTMTGSLPLNYSLHTGSITLPTLSKTGYIFEGWYDTAPDSYGLFTGTKVEEISATETGDKTLWASFTIELKEGPAFNTAVKNWNAATKILASPLPPDSSIAATAIRYLDTAETYFPVWWDPGESCVKYYADGYTNGTRKFKLRSDSKELFKNCNRLEILDLSYFDSSQVTDMSSMFSGDGSLETVYVSDAFVTDSVITSDNMFASCTKIKGENGYSYNNSNPKDKTLAVINTASQNGYFWRKIENSYYITYDLGGGTNNAANPVSYTADDLPLVFSTPNKTGYNFDGWYTSSDFSGSQLEQITSENTGHKTLYAKWTPTTYIISFTVNEGTWVDGYASPPSYTVESPATLPTAANITKTGYTFNDWYENSSFTGSAVTATSSTTTGDKTYYAKWTIDTYTITYETNDGSFTDSYTGPAEYTVASPATLPTSSNITKTGYTFGGWYQNSSLTGTAVTATSSTTTGNKTYYAKWTATEYSITYNLNSGTNSSSNPSKYTIESSTITLAAPTRTSYTFDGWYTTSGFTEGTKITSIPAGSTGAYLLYAKWVANVDIDVVISQIQNAASGELVSISGAFTTDDFTSLCSAVKARTSAIGLDLSDVVGITTLANTYLNGAGSKVNYLVLPDGLTTINSTALHNLGSTSAPLSITIPKNVSSISDQAFFKGSISEILVDPDNQYFSSYDGCLYTKDYKTFKEHPYKKTGEITLKPGVEIIASQAFAGRDTITEVNIPSSIKTIKANAFANIATSYTINISSLGASSTLTFAARSFNQNNNAGCVTTINYSNTKEHFKDHVTFENNWNSSCSNDTNMFTFSDGNMTWAEFMEYYNE